ncbi:hypothetical protein [Streptomyces sp. NPDC002690]
MERVSGHEHLREGSFTVPYIASWSAEMTDTNGLLVFKGSLRYMDESPLERRDGATWLRMTLARGRGRANLGFVHPVRQRRAMRLSLCQVCGKTTIDQQFNLWGERFLYLVAQDQPIEDGEVVAAPPVHLACAIESVRDCPHLRRGHTLALVESAPVWGVFGRAYDPRTGRPLLDPKTGEPAAHIKVEYGDPRLKYMLATSLCVSLYGCTPVTLVDGELRILQSGALTS